MSQNSDRVMNELAEDQLDESRFEVVETDEEMGEGEILVDFDEHDRADFDEQDDNPYQESDEALPDDSEEAAIASYNSKETRG